MNKVASADAHAQMSGLRDTLVSLLKAESEGEV